MKQLVAGILAHVDAGKTTLSEGILYQAGSIRKLGRVDHKDAYLDTDAQERSRGITIFSKPAQLRFREMDLTLIDTPGHVDFSAEMERTLQVLDCAVLVISGTDGVQGHTETLWRLLAHHRIPTFVFVNKMDLSGADRELRLLNLKSRLSDSCIDFSGRTAESFYEELALCSEELLEEYMERGRQETSSIASAIKKRLVFPVFFGSALKLDGVDRLLDGIEKYCPENEYPEEFGAKVYKIGRDDQGKRLTWMKITGGRLCVRELLSSEKNGTPAGGGQNRAENAERDGLSGGSGGKNRAENAGWNGLSGENSGQNRAENAERDGLSGESSGENRAVNAGKDSLPGRAGLRRSDGDTVKEKVDQIRIYNGAKYRAVDCAPAGTICAVTGLTHTCPGQGFGAEPPSGPPLSVPVMTWRLLLPEGTDASVMLKNLRLLEEEEPLLHIRWNAALQEIQVQLMGEVQIEVLTELIRERFGAVVRFDQGSIMYRETISETVEGMGHYEPLRHYAEVHLLMEPGEPDSGLVFASAVSVDELDGNWQRLILTHLEEREHPGVLTGSPVTDMKITLAAGRGHIKHTEGGDFRQATYRAVRHGLMRAKSVLLEPYYEFRLELPPENLGRAMADIERMCGEFGPPEQEGEYAVLSGSAPVSELQGYTSVLTAYSHGLGRIVCRLKGYAPCHNAEQVIAAAGYRAGADIDNPADSVFCANGAGFTVPWQEAENYMHIPPVYTGGKGSGAGLKTDVLRKKQGADGEEEHPGDGKSGDYLGRSYAEDRELEEIFKRTFGEVRRRTPVGANSLGRESAGRKKNRKEDVQLPAVPGTKTVESGALPKGHKGQEARVDRRLFPGNKSSGELPEYLLVDGYNVIFAWEELTELARENLDSARQRLMDILCNYQGYVRCRLILVFDAYRVRGGHGEVQKYHNIHVVYTREAETADMYIEKVSHELGRKYHVTVATSDALEQLIVIGQGAVRISSRELKEEVEHVTRRRLEEYTGRQQSGKNYPLRDALERSAADGQEGRD